MYPNFKPVRQRIHLVHLKKAAAIKAEFEIFLRASFIYPVLLIEWVSNNIPILKNQGTIRACIDY